LVGIEPEDADGHDQKYATGEQGDGSDTAFAPAGASSDGEAGEG